MRRREFMIGTLAVGAAPAGVALTLRNDLAAGGNALAIVEGTGEVAARFAAALAGANIPVLRAADPTAVLFAVERCLVEHVPCLLGLTRPSGELTVAQRTALAGYRRDFFGVHLGHDGLSHRLEGTAEMTACAAGVLARARDGWPAALARYFGEALAGAPIAPGRAHGVRRVDIPATGTGAFTSWLYTRA